jgi:hypothetical protein
MIVVMEQGRIADIRGLKTAEELIRAEEQEIPEMCRAMLPAVSPSEA